MSFALAFRVMRRLAERKRSGEPLLWSLVSRGWTPSSWPGSACGTVILEVRGRASGRLLSPLVTWVEHDGARHLVSMPPGEPGWVKNMRAGGGRVVLRHGRHRTEVRLEELPVDRRAPVLRAWYAWTALSPVPRRHFGLPRRADVREFERIAAEHPVFRVVRAETVGATNPVTRDVEPSAVRDLLDDPPRATLAFMERDATELLPVQARFTTDMHRFGVLAEYAPDVEGREVILLRDDGAYWFELRGISVRGVARRLGSPQPPGGLVWYAVEPRRILAWDYGTIRYA